MANLLYVYKITGWHESGDSCMSGPFVMSVASSSDDLMDVGRQAQIYMKSDEGKHTISSIECTDERVVVLDGESDVC